MADDARVCTLCGQPAAAQPLPQIGPKSIKLSLLCAWDSEHGTAWDKWAPGVEVARIQRAEEEADGVPVCASCRRECYRAISRLQAAAGAHEAAEGGHEGAPSTSQLRQHTRSTAAAGRAALALARESPLLSAALGDRKRAAATPTASGVTPTATSRRVGSSERQGNAVTMARFRRAGEMPVHCALCMHIPHMHACMHAVATSGAAHAQM